MTYLILLPLNQKKNNNTYLFFCSIFDNDKKLEFMRTYDPTSAIVFSNKKTAQTIADKINQYTKYKKKAKVRNNIESLRSKEIKCDSCGHTKYTNYQDRWSNYKKHHKLEIKKLLAI